MREKKLIKKKTQRPMIREKVWNNFKIL